MEITQTSIKQRIQHAAVFAGASSILIGASQIFVNAKIDQILLSGGVDFVQTFFSSYINQTFYNALKAHIHRFTIISEEKIIGLSILIVSTLGVGAPKYIIHQLANTKGPETISIVYLIGNIVTMLLYEKIILQPKK